MDSVRMREAARACTRKFSLRWMRQERMEQLYVILVAHLGENGTTERWTSDAVIAHTNGIDAVIDGHSHETIPDKTVANKDGKQIPLTQTGTKLKNIGKLTIKAAGTITTELVDKVPQRIPRPYIL